MKFKDRRKVFNEACSIALYCRNALGSIAQNEFNFEDVDLHKELFVCDDLVNKINNYKRLLILEVAN